MKNLILVGAGDWGLEVWAWLDDAVQAESWKFKGFLDKRSDALQRAPYCSAKVLGNSQEYEISEDDLFVCTIADAVTKISAIERLTSRGAKFTSLVHKSVLMFKNVRIGDGVVISPNVVVSNNVSIGNHVSINLACTLGHDVTIGNYCQINSQCDLTGGVTLGDGVFVGSRATFIPGVHVGDRAKVGAGSVVIRNVKSDVTVFGNPAKSIT